MKTSIGLAFSGMILLGLTIGTSGVLLPSLSVFYHVGDASLGALLFITSIGYCLSALSCGLLDTGFNIFISTQPRSPVLLNYLHAFWGAGSLVGPLLATGMLALLWGWNSIYIVLLVLSLPLLPGIIWLMREPSSTPVEHTTEPSPKGGNLGALLTMPVVWLLIAFLLLYVGIEQSVGNWGYSFLLEDRAQGAVLAGWWVSGFWLGITLGRFLIQRQAERMGLSNTRLVSLCIVGILVGLVIIWLIPVGVIAGLGFCFLGFSLAPIFPSPLPLSTNWFLRTWAQARLAYW